jgi:plasminogen activator inhibitor 1 RNA-binding protein
LRAPTDDGSEPVVTSQPKPTTQAKPAAAAAAAPREVPGSKPPRGRGGDATAARGARGGQYYARGGPRNVIKTEGQAAEVIAVEPETGFEGERRGQWKWFRIAQEPVTESQNRPCFTAPSRGQGAPRGEGRGRGRATRARGGRGGAAGGEGRKDGAYTGGERRHDGRKSAHALPDTEKRVASGWGAEEGTAELVGECPPAPSLPWFVDHSPFITAEVEGANDASEESATPQTPAAEGSVSESGSMFASLSMLIDSLVRQAEEVKPAAEEAVTGQHKTEEEEEDNTKSYEEYLAERAQAALNLNIGKLEGRKVEGTSEIVGAALQKPEEEEWYQGANKVRSRALMLTETHPKLTHPFCRRTRPRPPRRLKLPRRRRSSSSLRLVSHHQRALSDVVDVAVLPEAVIVDEVPQGTLATDPPEVVPVVDEVVPELPQLSL